MPNLLREYRTLNYDKTKINEAKLANQPIILTGILQRADEPNENGRIYPHKVLAREVDNYKKAVQDGRAIGECVPPGTKILTKDKGWVNIEDVHVGEEIYTLNLETDKIEMQKVSERVYGKHKTLYNFKSRTIDFTVSPGHRILLLNQETGKYVIKTAEELKKQIGDRDGSISRLRVVRGGGKWEGNIEGRKILAENSNVQYTVAENCSKGPCVSQLKVSEVLHDDYAYCIRVPNQTWLMKQDKRVLWTLNCDHPESSVVELKNASHIVREIWWDGPEQKEVWGKVEILNTPAGKILQDLMLAGVKLGISSRGVGETKKHEGHDMVEDSYMLIAFDMVSEPSTHNAFLFKEGKEIKLDEVRKMIPKIDRVNRAINEILVKKQ